MLGFAGGTDPDRDGAARKFDVIVFWSLDRFTREGTLATLKYLELLEHHGIRWRSVTEQCRTISRRLGEVACELGQAGAGANFRTRPSGIASRHGTRNEKWQTGWATTSRVSPGPSGCTPQSRKLVGSDRQADRHQQDQCSAGI